MVQYNEAALSSYFDLTVFPRENRLSQSELIISWCIQLLFNISDGIVIDKLQLSVIEVGLKYKHFETKFRLT